MFPVALPLPFAARSPRPRGVRARIVRGLDLAVEFATLGEYGVDEVEIEPRSTDSDSGGSAWDWPQRCAGSRARVAGGAVMRARRPL
jgi:hypothetical protein